MFACGGARGAALGLAALLVGAAPAPLVAAPRTLGEVFVYARAHAPLVTARRAERDEVRATARARGWWLPEPPSLAGEWSRTRHPETSDSRDRILEGGLRIEPLGQVVFRARAAGAERDRDLASLEAQARGWAAQVAWSYYELLRWQWLRSRASQQEATGQRLASVVERRFSAGDASQLETDLAQVEAAEAARRALGVERALQTAEARFLALIGWPYDEAAPALDSVQLVPLFPDTTGLFRLAMERSPELVEARAALDWGRMQAQLASAQLLPVVDLSAYGGTDDGDDVRGMRVGLSLPFLGPPLAERQARAAAARRAQAEYEAARRAVEAEVEAAGSAAALSYRQVRLFQERVLPGLEISRARFRKAYQIGEVDLTALLLHEQRSREAEEAFAAALADYTDSLRELEWTSGLPVLSGDTLAEEVQP